MRAQSQIVSAFALVVLLLFCSPIFALAIGILSSASPSTLSLRFFVGVTNNEVLNSVHSLLLPLIGAIVVFRPGELVGWAGWLVLLILCSAIVVGFFVFMATNPAVLGTDLRFAPYANEYKDVHKAIFAMIGMLTLLFLTKLGVKAEPAMQDTKSENLDKRPTSVEPQIAPEEEK